MKVMLSFTRYESESRSPVSFQVPGDNKSVVIEEKDVVFCSCPLFVCLPIIIRCGYGSHRHEMDNVKRESAVGAGG